LSVRKHTNLSPNTQCGQGKKIRENPQASELVSFINQVTDGYTRDVSWAQLVLKEYSLLEFEYALVFYLWQKKRSKSDLAHFFARGYQAVISTRRLTKGSPDQPCLDPPANWPDALQRIAIAKAVESEPVREFLRYMRDDFHFTPSAKEVAEILQKHPIEEMKKAWQWAGTCGGMDWKAFVANAPYDDGLLWRQS
jgi:hypothetical protein